MNLQPKQLVSLIGGGVIFLIALVTFLTSWVDVDPGYEGFIYRPYGSGVDTSQVYTEGTYFIAPWNEMNNYLILQESKQYQSEVMDKNGTEITLLVSVNYSVTRGSSAKLHLKHGIGYIKFVDDKSYGAIKDVVGRYTYEEVYSTKREALENEVEEILDNDFDENYMTLHYVEIADVNLPKGIADEIVEKETQKQRNKTSELKKVEEKNLADARFAKARGDSSLLITATYKAQAIEKESEQLRKSPAYIEYIKWKGYADGQGSPYGTNNVYGEGTAVIKQIK